jgi:hypothetical protein
MQIDKRDTNDSILEIADALDEDGELEIDILSAHSADLSVWLTKDEIKQLITHLISVL